MVHFDAHPDLSASTTLPAELILEDPHQARRFTRHRAFARPVGWGGKIGLATWLEQITKNEIMFRIIQWWKFYFSFFSPSR